MKQKTSVLQYLRVIGMTVGRGREIRAFEAFEAFSTLETLVAWNCSLQHGGAVSSGDGDGGVQHMGLEGRQHFMLGGQHRLT